MTVSAGIIWPGGLLPASALMVAVRRETAVQVVRSDHRSAN